MRSAMILLAVQLAAAATSADMIDAVKKGDGPAVESMLRQQPSLREAKNEGGVSAILLAVYYRHPEVARIFIAHGAQLSMAEACATGQKDQVAVYLRQDPKNANALSPDGFPALGIAVFFGHPDVARMLIAAGADVNAAAKNAQKSAVIHSAVAAGDLEIVRLLIEKGVDVNVKQAGGFTPLHEAAMTGKRAIYEVLIKAGADPEAKSDDGKTAADLAAAAKG